MAPTLVDIARETQTSVSTVSRVLAGGAVSRRISRQTCDRVREVASRMGYRPNLIARTLRTRKSFTVALLVSDIANPFFGQIGSLIEQSIHRHGYSLMLCNSGEDPEREQEYLQMLSQKAIDGLIMVPLTRSKKAIYQSLPASMPLVILDRPVPGITSSVAGDQEQATRILCEVLDRANVKRVAIVAGPRHIVTHRQRADIVAERYEIIYRHEGPAQKETGRQAFIKMLTLHPDAIVCTNNFLAQGVIDCIGEIDSPPIVAAFDEVPLMHLLPIPMVCSLQDVPMLAEGCVEQLLKQLEDGEHKPKPIVLPARAVTNRAFQKLHEPNG